MSSIDERVVEMKFNNAQFQSGVKDTTNSLDDLKKGLDLNGATRGLDALQAAGDAFDLGGIADNVDAIADRFSNLGIVAVTALANITSQAVSAGIDFAKSFTVAPIRQGFDEYNLNLNSIQTILSNTQASGATLKDVNATLNELNQYSDKTIYNFAEMARNIGTFTAAGVSLKPATAAIKGIANLSALSGSNSQQAAGAMYQLSQAIANGKVGLQDWNSVNAAGIGGATFQKALTNTAVAMGVLNKNAVKLVGPMKTVKIAGQSFRESIGSTKDKPSWLSSEVLTATLSQFTGDMTKAQLVTQGFTEAQAKGILKMGKTALDAASIVKTFPALVDTLRQTAGSGYAQTSQLIIGDFEQAKELFTNINNVFSKMLNNQAKARNKILSDWQAGGGRDLAIDAIAKAFKFLMAVIAPVRKAFEEIFPPATGAQLVVITRAISDFADKLKVSGSTADKIQRTFAGVFAVLDIVRMVVFEVVKTLFSLFSTAGDGASNFLDVTAAIGDFLVGLRYAVKTGNGLQTFFEALGNVIRVPLTIIGALVGALADLAMGIDISDSSNAFLKTLDDIGNKLGPLKVLTNIVGLAWERLGAAFGSILSIFLPIGLAVGEVFKNLGTAIRDSVTEKNFDHVLDFLNTGFFGALTVIIGKFLHGGFDVNVGGGFVDSIKGLFEGVTGALESMQQNLKANVLLKIAGALGILTASIFILSTIDTGKLAVSLGAITVMFAQLGGALVLFEKISSGPGLANLPLVAGGLLLLAGAILILSIAVKKLADLNIAELGTGLLGVTVLLGALVGTTRLLDKNSAGMIRAGIGLIAIAVALRILVGAVETLAKLDLAQLVQGTVAVAAILAAIAGFTLLIGLAPPQKMFATGVAMVLIAAALNIIASAISTLGNMSLEELAKGIGAMTVALAAIGGALLLIQILPNMAAAAASLLIVSAALVIMAQALQTLGGMSMDEIAKSIGILSVSLFLLAGILILLSVPGVIAGAGALIIAAAAIFILAPALVMLGNMDIENITKALGILSVTLILLAGTLILMVASLPGAAALIVAALAIAILTPALVALGSLDIAQVGIALLALAGALAILAVAGVVLTPLVPTLLGVAGAIALFGLGLLAAGVGILAFAAGLTALGVAGAAGGAGLVALVSAVLGLIPLILSTLAQTIVEIAGVIEDGAPAIINAIVALLVSALKGAQQTIPEFIKLATKIVVALLDALIVLIPKLVDAGLKILTGVVNGIANNIGKISDAATKLIVNFAAAIGRNLPKVLEAGADLIIKLVRGLAKTIREKSEEMRKAGGELALAIIDGMTLGLGSKGVEVAAAAGKMARGAIDAAAHALDSHSPSKEFEKLGIYSAEGYAIGLLGTQSEVKAAYKTMKDLLSDAIKSTSEDIDTYKQKIQDLTDARIDDQKAIEKQKAVLAKAKADTKAGVDVITERQSLQDLTKARAKDTREIRDARDAVKEAQRRQATAKNANARHAAERAEKNAKQRIVDLTDKRIKDTRAIEDQEKVLKQAIADRKNQTQVKEETDKLAKLRKERDKGTRSLDEAKDALKTAQAENPKATAAYEELTNGLSDEQTQLEKLSVTYENYTDQIKDADKAVDDAIKTRDDYTKSIKDQYSALATFVGTEDKPIVLSEYLADEQDQLDKLLDFTGQLQELRNRGLNDKIYTKLLQQGTDAMPFIQQLLDSGQDGLGDLQDLSNRLDTAAAQLGSTASTQLYQAGVDSAKGFANGLRAEQESLQKTMNDIAEGMVNTIKAKLGIKSPSRVFAEVGGYSMEGLANGMNSANGVVGKAAENAGSTAISSLRRSMSGIATAVATDMDFNPTIRPVLDLSAVQEGASSIGGLLGRPVLSVSETYRSAGTANDGYNSNQEQMLAFKEAQATSRSTVYNQYNNSPKALSAAEIYRNTKNQLSVAKED